jgi:hypothetical protein
MVIQERRAVREPVRMGMPKRQQIQYERQMNHYGNSTESYGDCNEETNVLGMH